MYKYMFTFKTSFNSMQKMINQNIPPQSVEMVKPQFTHTHEIS